MVKADAALAPFLEFGTHIFGQENNLSGPANELVFFRVGLRSDQRQHCSAIRRGDGQPAIAGRKGNIKGQAEPELVQIESQA